LKKKTYSHAIRHKNFYFLCNPTVHDRDRRVLSTKSSFLTSSTDTSLPVITLVWASAQYDSWLCWQKFWGILCRIFRGENL